MHWAWNGPNRAAFATALFGACARSYPFPQYTTMMLAAIASPNTEDALAD